MIWGTRNARKDGDVGVKKKGCCEAILIFVDFNGFF